MKIITAPKDNPDPMLRQIERDIVKEKSFGD